MSFYILMNIIVYGFLYAAVPVFGYCCLQEVKQMHKEMKEDD